MYERPYRARPSTEIHQTLHLAQLSAIASWAADGIYPWPVARQKDDEFSFNLIPNFVAAVDFWPKAGDLKTHSIWYVYAPNSER